MIDKLILIVDDSKTVRASLDYTLGKVGYQVVTCEDGQMALSKLDHLFKEGQRPAMIITDINMPVMDGITFIKKVKQQSVFKFIPILVLTTESQEHKKLEGKRAGASGWLIKPFKAEQLETVVKKFVK